MKLGLLLLFTFSLTVIFVSAIYINCPLSSHSQLLCHLDYSLVCPSWQPSLLGAVNNRVLPLIYLSILSCVPPSKESLNLIKHWYCKQKRVAVTLDSWITSWGTALGWLLSVNHRESCIGENYFGGRARTWALLLSAVSTADCRVSLAWE